jgi:hypothetical protein
VENTEVTLEHLQKDIRLNVVDIADFNDRVVGAYNAGTEKDWKRTISSHAA